MRRTLGIVCALVILLPAASWACGIGYHYRAPRLSGPKAIKMVAKAEAALARGKFKAAAEAIGSRARFSDPTLQKRANRVRHLAKIRQGDQQGSRNAAAFFTSELDAHPEDPVVTARLAEALAVQWPMKGRSETPEMIMQRHRKARHLLEGLDKYDSIPDARGYATLGMLRGRAGDAVGAKQARKRCRAVAKRKSICRAPR